MRYSVSSILKNEAVAPLSPIICLLDSNKEDGVVCFSFSLITLLICTDAQISQQTSEILVSIANLETSTPYPHRGRGKSKAILLALILIAASAAASTTLCLSK